MFYVVIHLSHIEHMITINVNLITIMLKTVYKKICNDLKQIHIKNKQLKMLPLTEEENELYKNPKTWLSMEKKI